MAFEFSLPDIGEGVVEGEIVSWKVTVGQTVAEDQPLVEVMTDKATVEIPSPRAGQVQSLTGGVGDVIEVGAVLVVLDEGDGAGDDATLRLPPEELGDPPASEAAPAAEEAPAPAPPAAPAPSNGSSAQPATASWSLPQPRAKGSKVLATPATRRVARELGIDFGTLRHQW